MIAGYVHRADAAYLSTLARSSVYLNAISNRLGASSQRAAFLGMVVGTAISELVDPIEKRMKFSSEHIDSLDGQWYLNLTKMRVEVGVISDLKPVNASSNKALTHTTKGTKGGQAAKPTTKSTEASKIISIEEVFDDSESEEEDLPAYQKPDSDESDEDEDPTLVQRDKPAASV